MRRFDDFTDEDLAAKAQGGNEDAREALVKRYWDLAGIIAEQFKIRGVDAEDRRAEAFLGMEKAIRAYATGKGTKFKTWLKTLMTRALVEMWREQNAKSEIPGSALLRLDMPVGDGGEELSLVEVIASGQDVEGETLDRLEAEAARRRIEESQSAELRAVLSGLGGEGGEFARKVLRVARELLDPELYASLQDILSDTSDQPRLIQLAPARGTEEAEELAQSLIGHFCELQWSVLCDAADGYTHAEIAERKGIGVELVGLLTGTARKAAAGGLARAA
jgi:RNA polymerase sigma factor (sigma-70 family)